MEFKFRAVDDRQPLYCSPSSSLSYFTDQAWRAGLSSTDRKSSQEQMRNPNDVREAIQREIEKERIREEIIVADIARRRLLEEEVRREVMMEREIAMRRLTGEGLSSEELLMKERIREEIIAAEMARRRVLEAEVRRELMVEREMARRRLTATGLSLEEPLRMRFDSRLPPTYPSDGRTFPVHGSGFDMFPTSLSTEAMKLDIRPPSEINKDKLIILAKPKPNLSRAKEKAVKPSAGSPSEPPTIGLKKMPMEEWSCALCQVSAANERGLNEHLRGKKHKAKETGLRQRMGKIASSTSLPKECTKPSQLTEITDTGSSGLQTKTEGESLQHNKVGGCSCNKVQVTENLKNKVEQVSLQKNQITGDSKKANGTATGQGDEKTTESKKPEKFEFWCEICQIGTYSQAVMENHKNGKKITDTGSSGLQTKIEGESLQHNKVGGCSCNKAQVTENLKHKVEQVSVQKNQIAGDSKKANGTATRQGDEKTTESKKPEKFEFWCEICQIGTYSQAVMENHKNGKKHRAQLQNLGIKDEVVVNKVGKASSDHTPKAADTDFAAKEV
ncbi:hypothetical protein F2P56_034717 [Juglans regia]|uniref:Uncharacterized protein n=2 Tax=Juglans regia TaxID=51240 RepID=A0A833SQ77_JUGRE|nr:zinc finger RNA-binding protein-like [Juglans regia]KAF5445681.1 hypothetical protein F2P56_034717 [Juglans regia]